MQDVYSGVLSLWEYLWMEIDETVFLTPKDPLQITCSGLNNGGLDMVQENSCTHMLSPSLRSTVQQGVGIWERIFKCFNSCWIWLFQGMIPSVMSYEISPTWLPTTLKSSRGSDDGQDGLLGENGCNWLLMRKRKTPELFSFLFFFCVYVPNTVFLAQLWNSTHHCSSECLPCFAPVCCDVVSNLVWWKSLSWSKSLWGCCCWVCCWFFHSAVSHVTGQKTWWNVVSHLQTCLDVNPTSQAVFCCRLKKKKFSHDEFGWRGWQLVSATPWRGGGCKWLWAKAQ